MFEKSPAFLTSVELEEAIRRHRDETKKLLAEVRRWRSVDPSNESGVNTVPVTKPGDPRPS